jgi:hypothetical protein
MSRSFEKQPASRANVYQNLSYVGGASGGPTVLSTFFGKATQQIRVISSLAGWASIDQSTSSTLVSSTSIPAAGFQIPASQVGGEYFICTPGQFLSFCSTSTSSGYISITEMA